MSVNSPESQTALIAADSPDQAGTNPADHNAELAPAAETENPAAQAAASISQLRKYHFKLEWAWKQSNALNCSPTATCVLLVAATNCDFDTGRINITQNEISAAARISPRTTIRAIKELQDHKLIYDAGLSPGAWGKIHDLYIPAGPDTTWGLTDPQQELDNDRYPLADQRRLDDPAFYTISTRQMVYVHGLLTECDPPLTWEQAVPIIKARFNLDFKGMTVNEVPRHLASRLLAALHQIKYQSLRQRDWTGSETAAETALPILQPELDDAVPPPLAQGDPDPNARDLWNRALEIIQETLPAHIYGAWIQDTQGHRFNQDNLEITVPDSAVAKHLETFLFMTLLRALRQAADNELGLTLVLQPKALTPV